MSGTILIMLLYTLMAWTETNHHFKNEEFLMNTVNSIMIFAREYHVMITTDPDSLRKLLNESSTMLLLAFSASFSFQPSLTRDSVWRGKWKRDMVLLGKGSKVIRFLSPKAIILQ